MGYVFNQKDSAAFEKERQDRRHIHIARLEGELMCSMLKPVPGETVLDIGCGIGTSLLTLLDKGLDVTGLEPSPYMLDVAYKRVGDRAGLYRGVAEDLPFEDNSFNLVVFFASLEFVDDPRAALREACRVAKDKIFIGVMNRYAIKGLERRVKGVFSETIYNKARFFSVWELKAEIRNIMGDVPVQWKTVCHLPFGEGKVTRKIESVELIKRFPFGAFAGVSALLVPRFRTRPLALKYAPAKSGGALVGSMSTETMNSERMPDAS
jgi:SAM-dependent methyltransferase